MFVEVNAYSESGTHVRLTLNLNYIVSYLKADRLVTLSDGLGSNIRLTPESFDKVIRILKEKGMIIE